MKIRINLSRQTLELFDDSGKCLRNYAVSTSKMGPGEQRGSFRTPRGRHIVRARIGEGQPENAVFVRRRPTGEIYSRELADRHPGRDWILTRILWLSGCEPGRNRLGDVDTMRRLVYIHGTRDGTEPGPPKSIGCIRMRKASVLELFGLVPASTGLEITE